MNRFIESATLRSAKPITKFVVFALMFFVNVNLAPVHAEEVLYQKPPKIIADLVDVPPTPSASLSPDKKTLLLLERPTLPSIEEVSQPELRLAGLRINPKRNAPSRQSYLIKMYLMDLSEANPKQRMITGLPADARISQVRWSPDCQNLAFVVTGDNGNTLWLADPKTAVAHKLIDKAINLSHSSGYTWLSDGTIIAKLIPDGRGEEPKKDPVPKGPIVQENDGKKRPARTNPDLLKSPHDELLFDFYIRSQLARVRPNGALDLIGKPDTYLWMEPSPDAKHLLVSTTHRPYSYKVGLGRFPHKVEVWSLDGKLEKQIVDNPLAEEVPIDFAAVPTGPRDFEWRSDADATVVWAEARDGGDPKAKAEIRDEVFTLPAPFTASPQKLAKLSLRYGGSTWGDEHLALVNEWWWSDRKTRTFIIDPAYPAANPVVLWDRSSEDRYNAPGNPFLDRTKRGNFVLHRTAKGGLLLSGDGASEEGDRPFVDELDLKTKKTTRLWRSAAPHYEFAAAVLADKDLTLLTRRESVSQQPQYYLRNLSKKTEKRLTDFPNPNPSLANVQKKLLQYKRADGVKLSGMLYLPPGFEPGKSKPLPMLMWAYPSEFKSKDAAGQVQDSPYRFVRADFHGPLFALLTGYAVLDDPQFPIIGEGTVEPNDTYTSQLVSGAQAAIDEVVKLGVADRDRLAIGGHSYGAFTTANLLAHSNLYRAGIARSGAYNRTLTPFGFQSEERDFWKAKNVYIDMSPFTYADKIDEPILLIHGEADDNSGTYPIQSERLFEAIKGLGGRVRWVVLPAETHGYRARESVLHMLYEMNSWLDKHVKEAPKRPTDPSSK